MFSSKNNNSLIFKNQNEILEITAYGKNSLRVRATKYPKFSYEYNALKTNETNNAEIIINEDYASIENGKIKCSVNDRGCLCFYKDGKEILKEYYRSFRCPNEHSPCMNYFAREFKPIYCGDYELKLRFEAKSEERIFGMGQYQQANLNLKGCILELAPRNSQISIPFYISNLGYGFLWNNAGIGEVFFGENYTQWHSLSTSQMDYWITAEDTPKEILMNYTEMVGRAPKFPENALGLWQSKLRYRTQDEVLEVAREYKRRNLPLDVIIIDYFHWIRQGDWSFDPEYWPDPQGMVNELKKMGVRCMVSVWPTVDKKSINYKEMSERGLLVTNEHGTAQQLDFLGDTVYYDATNPEARDFIWNKVNENYGKYDIDMFWLDEAEPGYAASDFENHRHYLGHALKVANSYALCHAKGFYEKQIAKGQTDIVNLIRCAWVGSQKYGVVVWSGDIKSSFTSLRDQLHAGLNIGIAGIPWWSSDTGGFYGNITNEHFNELLIRWFQFSCFCPVLRLHGYRGPYDIPTLSDLEYGGGFAPTGHSNELWSYGEEVYAILKKYLGIRESMRDYIKMTMDEASENGSPVMRTMFYEFPEDERCWTVEEQYMFGSKYLVAPVLYQGMKERSIYLPSGSWKCIHSGKKYIGGKDIIVNTPIEIIPVFEKLD